MASESTETGSVHYPVFITEPGSPDVLFNVIVVFMLVTVFAVGAFYFKLHALPERMAHRASPAQFQIVAILSLIALFTHNNAFWIAALLLAAIRLPDFLTPLRSIANSLESIAGRDLSDPEVPDSRAPDDRPALTDFVNTGRDENA